MVAANPTVFRRLKLLVTSSIRPGRIGSYQIVALGAVLDNLDWAAVRVRVEGRLGAAVNQMAALRGAIGV